MTESECSICLAPFSGSTTTVGCCRKVFHTTCYVRWMQNKLECPMCRAPQESLGLPGNILVVQTEPISRSRKAFQAGVAADGTCAVTVLCVKFFLDGLE